MGFDARPGERYFGFGERSNAVDQRGNEVEDYVSDGPYAPADRGLIGLVIPAQGWHPRDDATYFPVPWLLSTAGYGVLLGNDETSYFRLGSSDPSAWSVEAQATYLSLRFVAGPAPADALRRLTEITGRQPAPAAPWVFGPWYQPTGNDQLGQARALRAADVPGSAVNTYLHYLPCGAQQGVESQQPPFTTGFHDLGYAITAYFNPMICTSYQPAYSQAVAARVLNTNQLDQPYVYNLNTGNLSSPVSQVDFTAPGTQSFWGRLLSEAVGQRIRRLDGGLRRVHAIGRQLRGRHARDAHAQPLPDALPLRHLRLCPRRAAPGGAVRALRVDRDPTMRPDRLGRRPDHRLGVRRPRLGDQAGSLAGGLGNLALGLRHRRLLQRLHREADPRIARALDRVRRRLWGDADRGERVQAGFLQRGRR